MLISSLVNSIFVNLVDELILIMQIIQLIEKISGPINHVSPTIKMIVINDALDSNSITVRNQELMIFNHD